MDEKFVYAVYDRIEEANKAVQNLTNAGIPVSAISLYADDDVVEEANQSDSIIELEELEEVESKSFWNRITDFFGGRDDDDENFPVDFKGYQDELDDEKILVVVDKTYEGEALSVDTAVNVLGENDPNQVETFTHKEDYDQPDDSDKRDERIVVAGDNSYESDDAEAYYTNIDSHRPTVTNEPQKSEHTNYEKDPVADKELRTERDKNAVAGDMGDSSDYSEYYQVKQDEPAQKSSSEFHDEAYYLKGEEVRLSNEKAERNREYRGVADIKRPVTKHSNNDPRLGEFEADMRRFDDYPPADEEGVNPEQYGANKAEQHNNQTDQAVEPHELGEFEAKMRRHDDNPPADEEGVNPEQFEDKN